MPEYKYYNVEEFTEIINLKAQGEFNKLLKRLERYIQKYPLDTAASVSYASILLDMGFIDEAEKVLNKVEVRKKTRDKTINYLVVTQIKLLCCQSKFKECYELVKENEYMLKAFREDYHALNVFLRKKLNLHISENIKEYSYTIKQINNYDEYLAIEHIKQHAYTSQEEKTTFKENFPIEETYYIIKKCCL